MKTQSSTNQYTYQPTSNQYKCFTQSATSTSISVKKHLIVNECYWGTLLFIAEQSWCSTECIHQTVDYAISARDNCHHNQPTNHHVPSSSHRTCRSRWTHRHGVVRWPHVHLVIINKQSTLHTKTNKINNRTIVQETQNSRYFIRSTYIQQQILQTDRQFIIHRPVLYRTMQNAQLSFLFGNSAMPSLWQLPTACFAAASWVFQLLY